MNNDNIWPIGLFVAFLVVVAANATMIWFATGIDDPVVESYTFGKR